MLTAQQVALSYGNTPVLDDISFHIKPGQFTVVIGPNGCGKSTLLKALCRLHRTERGSIKLQGRDINVFSQMELARQVALVRQSASVAFDFTVEEIVLLGRLPYVRRFQAETAMDWDVVERYMRLTGLEPYRHRRLSSLSGGERQRVFIAQALVQEPQLLLLDEPTNHLDINHQIEILDLIWELNQKQGLTVIAVLHDLNLASLCSSSVSLRSGN